ncbi:MAG: family 10 glycosylhydrolase [Bacilli bacterium]|jgi:uncharacterized lipoprotein YddW (UPF0748 family)
MIKKVATIFFGFIIVFLSVVVLNAQMIGIPKFDGSGTIKYRDSNEVLMNEVYVQKPTELRGVWVTPLVGDIPSFTSETQYKAAMNSVFDVMEYYNMNAIIYHVRIMNDALYPSELNPYSSYYNGNSDWNALEWIISESHRRGIEFHAWMNPYRVKNSYSGTLEDLASTFPETNAASNPENLIKNSSQVILDPGQPAVRQFLLDTCQELMDNYDIDAIHFDDYFYIDNNDDSATFEKYNPDNLLLADWRRLQVDTFIEDLHHLIEEHNVNNNKYVQLGISPSGVWRNGDGIVSYDSNGNAITNGSNTLYGFAHYDNYLYSDTVKWINEEWIDYIVPQVYFALEHATTPYADIMQWWDKVVEHKDVSLYAGIGLHIAGSSGNVYSWQNSPYELSYELRYNDGLKNSKGSVLFSYRHMKDGYNNKTSMKGQNMENARNDLWTEKIFLPQSNVTNNVFPGYVRNLKLEKTSENNIISWDKNPNARYYALYRSEDEITYSTKEIYDIFGSNDNERYEYIDETGVYNYAVVPVSKTNTLGNGTIINSDFTKDTYTVEFFDKDNNSLKLEQVPHGATISPPQLPRVIGYTFKGWDQDFSSITEDLKIYSIYEAKIYTVEFCDLYGIVIDSQNIAHGEGAVEVNPIIYDNKLFVKWDQEFDYVTSNLKINPVYEDVTDETRLAVQFLMPDGSIIKEELVKYKTGATAPVEIPKISGYHFTGWDKEFNLITTDLVITAVFSEGNQFIVKFMDKFDNEVKTESVIEGNSATSPTLDEINGFIFKGWDQEFSNIESDLIIRPLYEELKFSVKFYSFNDELIKNETVKYGEDALAPKVEEIEGYLFKGWDTEFTNVKEDKIVKPLYEEIVEEESIYSITFKDIDGNVIEVVEAKSGDNLEDYQAPEVKGYTFKEWNQDLSNIDQDLIVESIYTKTSSCGSVNAVQLFTIFSMFGAFFFLRRKK